MEILRRSCDDPHSLLLGLSFSDSKITGLYFAPELEANWATNRGMLKCVATDPFYKFIPIEKTGLFLLPPGWLSFLTIRAFFSQKRASALLGIVNLMKIRH